MDIRRLQEKINNGIDKEHTIRFGKYALFNYIHLYWEFGLPVDFKEADEYNNTSRDLLGFIVRLTSFTSKLTSFECQIAENESEKVVFPLCQTTLMPVKAT